MAAATDRRIITDRPPIPRPASDEQPPAVRPKWNLIERQDDAARIARLEDRVKELENAIMESSRAQRVAENTNALALYGESDDVKGLTKRLQYLLPNAEQIGQRGVALVAQIAIAHGLDPLPGSDHVYAWTKGDTLTVAIGYKGLLHLARKQVRFTHQSRAMTDSERAEHGLADGDVGFITTLYEIDKAIECKQAGIPYFPIEGSAKWKKGDSVPSGRTPAWVAKKNSLKDALRQITSTGQRIAEALDSAFMQQFGQAPEVTEDGWRVQITDAQELLDSGEIPADDDGPEVIEGETVPQAEPEAPGQLALVEQPDDSVYQPGPCSEPGCDQPGKITPVGFLCDQHARAKADAEIAAS